MRPRVITGIGAASALGVGGSQAHLGLLRKTADAGSFPPASKVTSFDASAYGEPAILEVPDFDPTKYLGDKGLRTLDRLTKLLVVAARLGLRDGGLKTDGGEWVSPALAAERVGVCCSNAYGSLEAITELDRVAVLEDARYINPAKFPNTVSNSASGYVSIWEDLRALNVSVSDGNCGALDAIALADIFLETGRADAILTGGGESMSEALFLAFDKLAVLGHETGKLRLGEAAAFLVLEPEERARARGARILGALTGYGTAFVAPDDEVSLLFVSREALARAIRQAVNDAGIAPGDIDLVVSGLSGIARFDEEERAAIESVVPDRPIATPKRIFGETLGAGGVLGITAALAAFDGPPPGFVGEAPPQKIRHVLVTSVGYYGNASAVVVRRV